MGVGHPVKTLPDVRGANARSAKINRACGVTRSFQVIRYKVEPGETSGACNLLANDPIRSALFDEVEKRRP
jgi:hypothetical protein